MERRTTGVVYLIDNRSDPKPDQLEFHRATFPQDIAQVLFKFFGRHLPGSGLRVRLDIMQATTQQKEFRLHGGVLTPMPEIGDGLEFVGR